MKVRRFLIAFMLLGLISAQGIAKDKFIDYNYEVTREECGSCKCSDPNYVIFMVYSYGKKEATTTDICLRNAVHGIMFKGLPASGQLGAVSALMGSTSYSEHNEYFNEFFKSAYKQYISETNKGNQTVIKCAKGLKVGIKVKVNIKLLKQRLKNDGILKDFKDMMM